MRSAAHFVGLDNYGSVLGDDSWFNALRVTGLVAGASVAAELVLGMIIALLINHSFRGRGLVRASVLVPWALTTVVSAKMWAWIYDGRYGIVNDVLMRLGVIDQPIIFLVRPEVTIWAMIAAEIWKTRTSVDFATRARLTADVSFDSLDDWAKIRDGLGSIRAVTGLEIVGLALHEAEINVTYSGRQEQLRDALAQQNLQLSNNNGQFSLQIAGATVANSP